MTTIADTLCQEVPDNPYQQALDYVIRQDLEIAKLMKNITQQLEYRGGNTDDNCVNLYGEYLFTSISLLWSPQARDGFDMRAYSWEPFGTLSFVHEMVAVVQKERDLRGLERILHPFQSGVYSATIFQSQDPSNFFSIDRSQTWLNFILYKLARSIGIKDIRYVDYPEMVAALREDREPKYRKADIGVVIPPEAVWVTRGDSRQIVDVGLMIDLKELRRAV